MSVIILSTIYIFKDITLTIAKDESLCIEAFLIFKSMFNLKKDLDSSIDAFWYLRVDGHPWQMTDRRKHRRPGGYRPPSPPPDSISLCNQTSTERKVRVRLSIRRNTDSLPVTYSPPTLPDVLYMCAYVLFLVSIYYQIWSYF